MAKRNKKARSYQRAAIALTPVEYTGLQTAYDHFNAALFNRTLLDVFITYQRKANSHGYFAADRFAGRTGDFGRHELALNPDAFIGQSDKQVCQTLVHEMHHVWQQHAGTPSSRGYHNQEWTAKMKANGLQPSSTGMVGGKETGQHMSDYIIPGGQFEQAYDKLAATGWKLNLQSAPRPAPKGAPTSKTKFSCASCGQNAWGKPDLKIDCHPCGLPMRATTESPAVSVAPPSYEINPRVEEPAKPKRGRPKGSKNKPKAAAAIVAIQSYDIERSCSPPAEPTSA